MKCLVASCNSDFHGIRYEDENPHEKKFSAHRIPDEPIRREMWLLAIGKADNKEMVASEINFKTVRICSKHFRESDFYHKNGRRFLMRTAVPTIFGGVEISNEGFESIFVDTGSNDLQNFFNGTPISKKRPIKHRKRSLRYAGDAAKGDITAEEALILLPKIQAKHTTYVKTVKMLRGRNKRLRDKLEHMEHIMGMSDSKRAQPDSDSTEVKPQVKRPAEDRFFDFLMDDDDDDDDDDDLDQDLLQVAKAPKLDRLPPKPVKEKTSKQHAKFCLCNSCRKERVAKAMEKAITPNKATQTEERGPQPVASPVPAGANQDSCRLCFSTDQLEPLCSGMIVVHDEMLDKIYLCTGILIIPRPKQSIFICTPCARLINSFHSYRQQVCSNNRAFNRFAARKVPEVTATIMIRKPAPPVTPLTKKLPPGLTVTPVVRKVPAPLPPGTQLRKIVPKAPVKIIQPEIPIVPPVEIKTEPEDPLEGCGEPALKIPPPVPVVPVRKPIKVPLPKIEVKTEPVPEPGLLMEAEEGGDELPEQETWKCWQCENSFLFQFECAKHMLQVHGENVAYIKQRMNLDELNANMLEMMSVHQRK